MKYLIPLITIFCIVGLVLSKSGAIKNHAAKPVIDQKNVKARFFTNSHTGTLFVISGMVNNTTSAPISEIEIKGTLVTSANSGFVSQRSFCGNILTDTELKTLSATDLFDKLSTKFPAGSSQPHLEPKEQLPFMVVFHDLPANLVNFTVQISDFKQHASQKEETIYDKSLALLKTAIKTKEKEWKK